MAHFEEGSLMPRTSDEWLELLSSSIQEAIANERKRCMHLVSTTQPNIIGIGSFHLQTMTCGEWMKLLKESINKAIANPE
jgi:truncated hemoglobin YjbI